jgi:hypothetical protein
MSGFCLQVRATTPKGEEPELRLIDIGSSDTSESLVWGTVRLRSSSRKQSSQWWTRKVADHFMLVEGQPDRHPSDTESLDAWLGSKRWGSFRGFEVSLESGVGPKTSIFVDPLSTRPLYFRRTQDQLLVSDKLSTIALNAADVVELNWPALLEAMTLGVLCTPDTTLGEVQELAPGELICFEGTEVIRRHRFEQPVDEEIGVSSVARDPAGTLLYALKKAVTETWTDSATWLMLSGGLDSRLVLALAGTGRRALTLDHYESETAVAHEIAAQCGSDLRVLPHPPSDFVAGAELSVSLSGGMHDPHFFNTLGMAGSWQANGVSSVTHAYLFDTLLKGYFLLPAGGHTSSVLSKSMPNTAKLFEWTSGRGSPFAADDVIAMLSRQGKAILHERLLALDASLPLEIERGVDATFEKRVLDRISRQVHYGSFLGWCEELDVSSPIFHPAVWTWYAHSSARDRMGGRAFIQALLSTNHGVLEVIDANTGVPPRMPAITWHDWIRRNPLYRRFLQPIWRRAFGAVPEVRFATGVGDGFRERPAFLDEGLAEMIGNKLFDAKVMESYRHAFLSGDDRYLEPLLVCASVGKWQRLVRERRAS